MSSKYFWCSKDEFDNTFSKTPVTDSTRVLVYFDYSLGCGYDPLKDTNGEIGERFLEQYRAGEWFACKDLYVPNNIYNDPKRWTKDSNRYSRDKSLQTE